MCFTDLEDGEDYAPEQGWLGSVLRNQRHRSGEWGDVGTEDRKKKTFSLRHSFGRSARTAWGEASGTVWIITEADRGATTILLPEEY